MSNIPENVQYGSPATQPSIANLSSIVKQLTQKAGQSSAKTVNAAILNHFNPTRASGMFASPTSSGTTINPAVNPQQPTFTPPVNAPFDPTTAKTPTEPLPEGYNQFTPADKNGNWVEPTATAEIRNWPKDIGGGQYIIDPSQPGKMIKSSRAIMDDVLNPGAKKEVLGGLSPALYQVDHNVPLWAGGADTLSNLQVLDLPTHEQKTAAQAVPLTLLAHGKINLSEARGMALSWKDKNVKGLPTPDNKGYVPLDIAERYAKDWQENPKGTTIAENFPAAFSETMKNLGNSIPVLGEFAKGLVGGGTAGIIPDTGPNPETGALGTVSNVAGNIVGTITGLGLLSKGLKASKAFLGIGRGIAIAEDASRAANLVTDIGNIGATASKARMITLSKMASNAGLLSLWGQIGLTGHERVSGDQLNFKNHVSQFLTDVAFGGLLGSAKQSIKGYATVGLGATALSLMEGQEIVPALQNGALMSSLHALGYQKGLIDPKTRIGNEEAYKMSATTFNQYLGDIIPTVKRGQTVPTILKLDIPAVDKMRIEYQQKYPEDQRFKTLGPITNEAEAISFMEQASRRQLGNLIAKSNGTIPQEQIKKEMVRIITAKNQLYNQTLDPTARAQKELADLISMGEKLRPQIKSQQLRPAIDATKTLNNTPFRFPDQIFENPQKTSFLTGNVPTTGYGENLDINAKQTITDYYHNPQKYSDKIFIVKDPETASMMRLVQQEQLANNGKTAIGNPDDSLRVFIKTQTPTGVEIKPIGYMPQEGSFDVKKNNLNKTYYEITNRLRHTIETAKSPETLQASLNKDKAQISIGTETAQKLFESKKDLKKMSDEDLYSLLKPKNALEKYSSTLNNSAISKEMDKHGLNILIVDKNKVLPVGGAEPRRDPTNPFIALNLNEQDWLRSLAMKDGKLNSETPIQQGIRNIVSKQNAQNMAKTSGDILGKVIPPMTKESVISPISPIEKSGLSKEDIKSLKKQGFSSEMIKKIQEQNIRPKPLIESYNSKEEPYRRSDLVPKTTQETIKPLEAVKIPETSKTTPKTPPITPKSTLADEFFNDMIVRIEDAKPDLSSAQNHERSLLSIVDGFKRKNPGVSDKDFKDALLTAKGRASAYVKDFIDNAYQGTKIFGTDEIYSRTPENENKNVLVRRYNELKSRGKETILKPFEKTEVKDLESKIRQHVDLDKKSNVIKTKANTEQRQLTDEEKSQLQDFDRQKFTLTQDYLGGKNSSLVLANKFGLELQPLNDSGVRFLKLDKRGNPSFSEDFKKSNGIKDQSPMDFWGSFLENEMKVYKSTLSKSSKDWGTGIEEMQKSNNPYAKGFAKALDESLKEKYDVKDPRTGETRHSWKDSWKANSALKNIKNWFDISNEEGYSNSQPFRRTAAITAGKNYEEIRKNVLKADLKTKDISEQAKENRLNLLSKGENLLNLPEGMSVKDPNQIENVSEDLTPLDMMTNGLLNTEVRNQLVDRYNNLRKEMGSGLAKSSPKTTEEMKILFAQIKKLSVNIPEEVKTWKEGSRINLKNKGEPTIEQGIKDGLRVASSIFKGKKTPGFIHYENIREKVLKQIGTNKNDGKGGPISTAIGNALTSKMSYGPYGPKMTINKTDDDIYNTASSVTQKQYGIAVPPHVLKAVRQQESSGIIDPNDYGRSMGLTPTAKSELGKNYLPDTSLANSIQNSANFLAKRAALVKSDGTKINLSSPENYSKWYVQRYVGLLPGQSRMINGQNVSYDKIKSSFEKLLLKNQPIQQEVVKQ